MNNLIYNKWTRAFIWTALWFSLGQIIGVVIETCSGQIWNLFIYHYLWNTWYKQPNTFLPDLLQDFK